MLMMLAAGLAWSGGLSLATRAHVDTPRAHAVCADLFGRCLGGTPRAPSVVQQIEASELKEATRRLVSHDKKSLATPRAIIEEYYSEYFDALEQAVRVLTAHSSSIMLGIMGDDSEEAVGALRSWQTALDLPQAPLRVLDEAGEGLLDAAASDPAAIAGMPRSAPAYLKFNSASQLNMLKLHEGPFRGVIVTAHLHEGTVRQFGGLPLALFDRMPPGPAQPGLMRT